MYKSDAAQAEERTSKSPASCQMLGGALEPQCYGEAATPKNAWGLLCCQPSSRFNVRPRVKGIRQKVT